MADLSGLGTCKKAGVWNDQGDKAQRFAPNGRIPVSEYTFS